MTTESEPRAAQSVKNEASAYDRWMESVGIPIHRGYFIDDLRNIELAWWDERECNAAFIQLVGQEGVSENRVSEIAPGKTLPQATYGTDEAIYVLGGTGFATVWSIDGERQHTFEWSQHSMFLLPRYHRFQLGNAKGTETARLMHYSYLPLVCSLGPDPEEVTHAIGGQNYTDMDSEDLYSQAAQGAGRTPGRSNVWSGNFFPDILAWDKLVERPKAGGGLTVSMQFKSPIRTSMPVFPKGSYWGAHRHGPGISIVIPKGEGYTVMWREGEEKMVIPWHDGSLFVPPDRWFHQHFNTSDQETRQLRFHLPVGMSTGWRNLPGDSIPHVEEDPWLRERYEDELGKQGRKSNVPPEAYSDPGFTWNPPGSAS